MEVIEIDWKLIERTERLLEAKNLSMPSSPETVETLHQGEPTWRKLSGRFLNPDRL
jgi:hypothetical protein